MKQEVVALGEITSFQSRTEEFGPYEWYKRMLGSEPAVYDEGTRTWNVFRHEEVKRVLSDYEHFSSERSRTTINVGVDTKEGSLGDSKINIINSDPPEHRKRRSLLSAAFTPRSLKQWEPRIQQVVDELIQDMKGSTEIDIVAQYATPLPVIIMSDLLGVPSHDRHLFKQWVDVLFLPFQKENAEEVNRMKEQAAKEYFNYLYPFVIQKRTQLAEDIISDLIRVEVDGERFTDDEIVRATMFLLGAGIETTSNLLANTFYAFLYDNPKVYSELRADLSLVPHMVEEVLRYRFNVTKLDRTVKKDNDLLGTPLSKGDMVIVWMSAANMDERVFEDPFTFKLRRDNGSKHLTFGNGPHFCLGAPLARLEANIAIRTFVETFRRIEPVPGFQLEASLQTSAVGQSLSRLPVRVEL